MSDDEALAVVVLEIRIPHGEGALVWLEQGVKAIYQVLDGRSLEPQVDRIWAGIGATAEAVRAVHEEQGEPPKRGGGGMAPTGIRLCVETLHPIDIGNYPGPIHCTAHPEGYACTTALYDLREGTVDTASDRHAATEPPKRGRA